MGLFPKGDNKARTGQHPEVGTELGKGVEDQEGLRELWELSLEKKRLRGTFLLSTTP